MTDKEKERYHRLIHMAELEMLNVVGIDPAPEVMAARCELARTIIEVARELRLGTTSRDTTLPSSDGKPKTSTTRLPRLPE
jgi:hypothetical protein